MAGEDIEDDEYVANLLKKDAQKTAKQYEMVGMDAFLPNRSRSGAPKPNTRFLRHIIRETDSHNTALLAKEAEESRARLKRMSREVTSRKRDVGRLTPPDLTDEDIHDRKRKRSRYDDKPEERHSRRKGERDHGKNKETGSRREGHGEDARRSHKERHEDSGELDSRRRRYKHSRDDHRRKSRQGEGSRRIDGRRPSYSRCTSRSTSPPTRKHTRSSRHRQRSNSRRRSPEPVHHQSSPKTPRRPRLPNRNSPAPGSDSDPLEAIVGPLPPPQAPPVRARGRGAHKANAMAMDARFSSTYDPETDVHQHSEVEDDWGDALEALKDRQRWKQQGAERLKAAGFSDEQVKRWEKGDEKTEEDVRWALKGEGREWDRGKVFDEDGHVNLKVEWGRLT